MADELYIPDGVYLKCDQGAIITNLTATPKKHKLYGLVIATEKDNVPLVNILPFGKCSSSGNACVPKAPQWKKVHEGATKIEGQKPLLETSYCKCMQGGNIDIFFDEESASASLDNDKKGRVDKIPWLDSVLGVVLFGPGGVVISKASGGEPADMGRGFRQGLKGTWNFLTHDMWQGETWEGIGNMIGVGIVGYMPPTMSQYPSQAEIEMMQEWVNTTPEERIAGFDESMGTDLTATHEGIKQAASDFWDRKIENGTAAEGGVMVGETAEFIVELAVGSKGAGAAIKGIKGAAKSANLAEKTAKAISTISEFVKTSKLAKFAESIKGIFKVGRKKLFTVDPKKFDYFFGRVTEGNPHNIQRSAQNAKDLATLGITQEQQLMDVFEQAMLSGNEVRTMTSQYGKTVVKSVSVGNKGKIEVSFFYEEGKTIPKVTSIIPKIYK